MSEKNQIEWRDPNQLTPYHRNNKKHPPGQIDKLAGAIAEFGFDQPIVVDAKGVIIKGHGRREAAIRLRLKTVPVIVRSDLSPAQVKASRLSDNHLPKKGRDDFEAISLEMEELSDLDFDLALMGFDPDEIDKFLGDSGTEFQDSEQVGGGGADSGTTTYPLTIVLSASELQRHKSAQEQLGGEDDREVYLALLDLAGI